MLEIKKLSVYYEAIQGLREVSLQVGEGEDRLPYWGQRGGKIHRVAFHFGAQTPYGRGIVLSGTEPQQNRNPTFL